MKAREVLERHREKLLAIPGVVGVGIGRDDGEVIELLVAEEGAYPQELEGVPLRIRVVGRLKADHGEL